MFTVRGLLLRHTVQGGILVPIQNVPQERGKSRKTSIELADRRTIRVQTDF
jgi:hypothetical protein